MCKKLFGRNARRSRQINHTPAIEFLEPRQLLSATSVGAGEKITLPGVGPEYTVYEQAGEFMLVQTDPDDGRLVNSTTGLQLSAIELHDWSFENVDEISGDHNGIRYRFTDNSAAPAELTLRTLPTEIDLDFGFNDYLEIRLTLPKGYHNDISFFFGTTSNSGFASDRFWVLPGSEIVADGKAHTYRFDLGLEVHWSHLLTDLKISIPTDGWQGDEFLLHDATIGDKPNDVLTISSGHKSIEKHADATPIVAKHHVTWYSPAMNTFNPATRGRNAIRSLEEAAQYYEKVLGYQVPYYGNSHHSTAENPHSPRIASGVRFKINHNTWVRDDGKDRKWAFAFNSHDLGIFNATHKFVDAVAHELAHVWQFAQRATLTDKVIESHANYLSETAKYYFQSLTTHSEMSSLVMFRSNLRQNTPQNDYRDLRLHAALGEFPERYGYPADTSARLWSMRGEEKGIYAQLAEVLPTEISLQDVLGKTLRHWPLSDLPSWSTRFAKYSGFQSSIHQPLIPDPIKPGHFRIPHDQAPERFTWASHELVVTESDVTVDLRGIDIDGSSEDWRWSLAAINDEGSIRYSDVWAPGKHSFSVRSDETRVVLVVVATPKDLRFDINFENKYDTKPYDKHPDRLRFPYEVAIDGATPVAPTAPRSDMQGAFHQNPDGSVGGWVASTAYVAPTAFVGPNAVVLDSAMVLDQARILDGAIVRENATVSGHGEVSGSAIVEGRAVITDNARVRDRSMVWLNAHVSENATIEGRALVGSRIYEEDRHTIVKGNAIVRGTSAAQKVVVSGDAILDGDFRAEGTYHTGVHFNTGNPLAPFQDKPDGLIASYRVENNDGELLWDEFGSQHALLRGAQPVFVDSLDGDVLQLDGVNQYVELDRSLLDVIDGTLAARIRPQKSSGVQPIFHASSDDNTRLDLRIHSDGHIVGVIKRDGTRHQVRSQQPVSWGQWTHVALTFAGDTMRLHIDGNVVSETTSTINPADILAANDYQSAESLFVGRARYAGRFQGHIDDIRFYNTAQTVEQLKNEIRRSGNTLGAFFYDAPREFNTEEPLFVTGIRSGGRRTISSSVYPQFDTTTTTYTPVFSSQDGAQGYGFGIQDGEFVVNLPEGLRKTGVAAERGQWHELTLYNDEQITRFSVNGAVVLDTSVNRSEQKVKFYSIGKVKAEHGEFHGKIKNVSIREHQRDLHISGPFTLSAEATFNDLRGGFWQRVFDFGNGPDSDNIALTQVRNSNDIKFSVFDGATEYSITAEDAIIEGVPARWTVSVDTDGMMTISRNGIELKREQGTVPNNVIRTNNYIGSSNWAGDSPIIGRVSDITILHTIPDQIALNAGGAFELAMIARVDQTKVPHDQEIVRLASVDKESSISLSHIQGTNSVRFEIKNESNRFSLIADNAIVERESARWALKVDSLGWMQLYKNGKLLNEQQGGVPAGALHTLKLRDSAPSSGTIQATGSVRDIQITPFAHPKGLSSERGLSDRNYEISGPFSLSVKARFDHLGVGGWQRIYDFGNGADADNIVLTQREQTNDIEFVIYRRGIRKGLRAYDAIVEGENATWTTSVDANGTMKIYKNGKLLEEGPGHVPRDIKRTKPLFGKSNWIGDHDLVGYVGQVSLVQTEKAPDAFAVTGPFAFSADVRFDSLAPSKQTIFETRTDSDDEGLGVWFGQVGGTDIGLIAKSSGILVESIVLPDAIVVGETARWTASIDHLGEMRIFKNGILKISKLGVVPTRQPYSRGMIGDSHLKDRLIGHIRNATIHQPGVRERSYDMSGAFEISMDVRFDSVKERSWQSVFESSGRNDDQRIMLMQYENTNDLIFRVRRGSQQWHSVTAKNAIVKGETARWTVRYEQNGRMVILKDGQELDSHPGIPPGTEPLDNSVFGLPLSTTNSRLDGDVNHIRLIKLQDVVANAGLSSPFSLSVDARFDDLSGGSWQRIYDFNDGSAKNNVLLTQIGNTNDLQFQIRRFGEQHTIVARDAITEGQMSTWQTTVDSAGWMRLYRDGKLLAIGKGVLPAAVDRQNLYFGLSFKPHHGELTGVIQAVRFANNVVEKDGQIIDSGLNPGEVYDVSGAFSVSIEARFDHLSAGRLQRLYEFSSEDGTHMIYLGQRKDTRDMIFGIKNEVGYFPIKAEDAIVEGETAVWTTRVSDCGQLSLYKNGRRLAFGNRPKLPSVELPIQHFGSSIFESSHPLVGSVRKLSGLSIANGDFENGAPAAGRLVSDIPGWNERNHHSLDNFWSGVGHLQAFLPEETGAAAELTGQREAVLSQAIGRKLTPSNSLRFVADMIAPTENDTPRTGELTIELSTARGVVGQESEPITNLINGKTWLVSKVFDISALDDSDEVTLTIKWDGDYIAIDNIFVEEYFDDIPML